MDEGPVMFERAGVSFVPGAIILAGVILLVASVFHVLLVWAAAISLALGAGLLMVACLHSNLPAQAGGRSAAPPRPEINEEG